jgi:hypothetical protein
MKRQNKTRLIVLVVVMTVGTLISINAVFAQNSNFLQYTGSSVGVDIKYPIDWVYNEYTNYFSNDDLTTVFTPSSMVSFNESSPSMDFASVTIGKQKDLPYKNMPLDLYLEYVKKLRVNEGNNITNVQKTKLSDGTPAYVLDIVSTGDTGKSEMLSTNNTGKSEMFSTNNTGKTRIVLMNKSPESYYFVYSASPNKFDTYWPIAQQMFKTVKITD